MFLLLILLLILVLGMIVINIAVQDAEMKPYKGTYIFLLGTCIHWGLFLTSFYVVLPESMADWLWDSIWMGLISLGTVMAILEFKKSLILSVLLVGFAGINLMFFLLTVMIGSM